MNRGRTLLWMLFAAALLAGIVVGAALWNRPADVAGWTPAKRPARVFPDYADAVIPPNIAPLNFIVREPGTRFSVTISSAQGRPLTVSTRSPRIVIPPGPWKELLAANRGAKLAFDVYVRSEAGGWSRFEPMTVTVAREPIDGWLVYREMPVYNQVWSDMGTYQRNLENYEVRVILQNGSYGAGCANCHTFLRNSPENMVMNVRGPVAGLPPPGGMLIAKGDSVFRIVDTKTPLSSVPAIYLAWHPGGKIIAFSTNMVLQHFHTVGHHRDTFDTFSDIALYLIDSNTVTTIPELCRPDRLETYPTWTPDGRWMYFCSAPQLPIERFREVRYDLMRIRYDADNDAWGKPETVLSAADTGLSISHPRISPDGKFLLCCMTEYGNFPAFSPSSDLYMLNLETLALERLAINSPQSDAYHSWSSNGRWIVFSSKRLDGVLAKPYFSYVDETGRAHTPFLLPQEDPAFYDSYIRVFNVPELIRSPVRLKERTIDRALYDPAMTMKAVLDERVKPPEATATPLPAVPRSQYVE